MFGEKHRVILINRVTRAKIDCTETYKRADWNEWHTDNEGYGLWQGDKQILGTCQFSVAGCKTEKAAKAKIRNFATEWNVWGA